MIQKFIDFLDRKKIDREIRGYSSNIINVSDYIP